jgi:hypothetical protein
MPDGLEKDLSPRQLGDLIAFVRSAGPPRKQFPLSRPEVVRQADDDGLTLAATTCEIYGASLVLEAKHRNLGYWENESDRAVWTFEVLRPGTFAVELDFACQDSFAGNQLAIELAGRSLTFEVPGTGTWDDYQQREVGKLELKAGRQQLVIRSVGPVRGAAIDLKKLRLRPVEKERLK